MNNNIDRNEQQIVFLKKELDNLKRENHLLRVELNDTNEDIEKLGGRSIKFEFSKICRPKGSMLSRELESAVKKLTSAIVYLSNYAENPKNDYFVDLKYHIKANNDDGIVVLNEKEFDE